MKKFGVFLFSLIALFVGRSLWLDQDWKSFSIGPDQLGGWGDARQSSLYDYPRWVRWVLRQNNKAIWLLIGGSNVREGLLAPEISASTHNAVINLGVGATNFTELRMMTRWVLDNTPVGLPVHLVLGTWYGLTITDQQKRKAGSGENAFATTAQELGCFEIQENRIRPMCSPFRLEVTRFFARQAADLRFLYAPERYMDHMNEAKQILLKTLGYLKPERTRPPLAVSKLQPGEIISAEYQENAFGFWNQYMGNSVESSEQYLQLEGMIRESLPRVKDVWVLDLPLPDWHWLRTPRYALFEERFNSLSLKFNSQVNFIHFDQLLKDVPFDFYDSVHPARQGREKLTRAFLERIASTFFLPSR